MIKLFKNYIKKLREEPVLGFMIILFIIFSGATFELMNRPFGSVRNLSMEIDNLIPLVPPMIIIYNLFGALLVIGGILLFVCNEDLEYKRYVLALFVGQFIAYIIFYKFQTYIPRPNPASLGDGIFGRLLKFTYEIDNPYNGLPSLHVTDMTLLMIGLTRSNIKKSLKYKLNFLAFLIAISTVLVKQHVFIDIPAGLLNATASYFLASLILDYYRLRTIDKLQGIND